MCKDGRVAGEEEEGWIEGYTYKLIYSLARSLAQNHGVRRLIAWLNG